MNRTAEGLIFRVRSVHADDIISDGNECVVWGECGVPPDSMRNEIWWVPELSPDTELMNWYSRHPDRWYEFRRRYLDQLSAEKETCEQLRTSACQRLLTLIYQQGTSARNMAAVIEEHLIQLESQQRWNAGLMIGGHTTPVKSQIVALGGLWFTKHKTWVMPDEQSWRAIINLLPGDF